MTIVAPDTGLGLLEELDFELLEMLSEGTPQCVLTHQKDTRNCPPWPACTHVGVATVKASCANVMGLGCAPGVEWVRARIANDDIRCSTCHRRPSECWSVMGL